MKLKYDSAYENGLAVEAFVYRMSGDKALLVSYDIRSPESAKKQEEEEKAGREANRKADEEKRKAEREARKSPKETVTANGPSRLIHLFSIATVSAV